MLGQHAASGGQAVADGGDGERAAVQHAECGVAQAVDALGMHIRAEHAAENLANLSERELTGEGHDVLRRTLLMAVEQIRPDRRPEQWCGSRRKILTSAQKLRFFPESPAALSVLLFQCHPTSKMRGCLRLLHRKALIGENVDEECGKQEAAKYTLKCRTATEYRDRCDGRSHLHTFR